MNAWFLATLVAGMIFGACGAMAAPAYPLSLFSLLGGSFLLALSVVGSCFATIAFLH